MRYMTEDDARQTWCPHARVLYDQGQGAGYTRAASFNRDYDESLPPASDCLASKCQMWEWGDGGNDDLNHVNRQGHCGLKVFP